MIKENPHRGSSFDDFLREEAIYEECTNSAIKRVLARQIAAQIRQKNLTKTAMAERMKTSRSQLERLLDPENNNVTLQALEKAAEVLGHKLRIELV